MLTFLVLSQCSVEINFITYDASFAQQLGMEAKPVLRDVKRALDENVLQQSAMVI
jgi:hypothetical protein